MTLIVLAGQLNSEPTKGVFRSYLMFLHDTVFCLDREIKDFAEK